jgi:hypothetical protein
VPCEAHAARIKLANDRRSVSDWRPVDSAEYEEGGHLSLDLESVLSYEPQSWPVGPPRSASVRVGIEPGERPTEVDRLANDLCGDVVVERDRLRNGLERADTLLMAAGGALGRARAHAYDAPARSTLVDALEDAKARLGAVSDTTLTTLHGGPSATSEGERQ